MKALKIIKEFQSFGTKSKKVPKDGFDWKNSYLIMRGFKVNKTIEYLCINDDILNYVLHNRGNITQIMNNLSLGNLLEIINRSKQIKIDNERVNSVIFRANKIINKIFSYSPNIQEKHKKRSTYNYLYFENLINEAKKYKTRKDFQKGSSSQYTKSRRLGRDFLNNICNHMIIINKHWTNEELKREALKYNKRNDFYKANPSAYNSARLRCKKFFNEICSHMIIKNNWNDNNIRKEALKYETKNDFKKGCPSAYYASARKGNEFHSKTCRHMKCGMDRRVKWTKEKLRKEALKYKTKSEFQENCKGGYKSSKIIGDDFFNEISSHMIDGTIKWTKEKLRKEALKYKTKSEFQKKNAGAYSSALKMNKDIYEEICSHMIRINSNREELYKKEKFQPKLEKILLENNINYDLTSEYYISNDLVMCKIDYVLKIEDYDLFIPIEIKHDDSYWNEIYIRDQLLKYNSILSKKNGMVGTYLISPNGKYGISENDFFQILNHLFKYDEIILP